ncbi:sarcosine oxidase subunit beta [Natranaerovirga pectinivora]|uniref:Sarcosine oxidase subunit beta n=1 Tax=Natranaerovirga pectinivora TaxID=682400 RepID=A0A4R3MRR1_9FIRM|nr:FAD-binding oxidoreductase [Natranaerovirga pectinivora]TCT16098.1 sarcosine oxidase subunit beta [Natranaerovirga pectinivora]
MNKFDVIVIGGGIIGLATSYYLLKSGKKVALIEKNEFGSGASCACDDAIFFQSKKPGINLELTIDSIELYKSLSDELGIDLELENKGGMVLIEKEDHLKVMEDFVKKQKKFGLKVDILDRRDVIKKQPHIRKDILASTYCKEDSQVNPLRVMRGFISKSKKMGLEIIKNNIIEIKEKKDGWKVLLEDKKTVESEFVVNATGAWASEIGKMIGIDIPIVPKRGQIAISEAIPSLGETNAWSAQYIVTKIAPELDRNQNEVYKRLGIGFALSQASTGNYIIGSTREYVGFNKKTTYEGIQLILKEAMALFPIFSKVNVIRTFAGLRPASEDGKPIVGEVEGKKGFYIAAGHEGDGIALAPITGKVVADLINGKRVRYNIEELNLKRFKY